MFHSRYTFFSSVQGATNAPTTPDKQFKLAFYRGPEIYEDQ